MLGIRKLDKLLKCSVTSETGPLKEVIIGSPFGFHAVKPMEEVHNGDQAHHQANGTRPTRDELIPEFDALKEALEEEGSIVYQPVPLLIPDQLTPRDIGVVIGNHFLVASMKHPDRMYEWLGIKHLLGEQTDNGFAFYRNVDFVPQRNSDGSKVILEGGDILVDNGYVFVGYGGNRTNEAGLEFLQQHLALHEPDMEIVPVELTEKALHLDCALGIVGGGGVLAHQDALVNGVPDQMNLLYRITEVSEEQMRSLAINVVHTCPQTVINRGSSLVVGDVLSDHYGVGVKPLRFEATVKEGGSFRCATLPLVRDN